VLKRRKDVETLTVTNDALGFDGTRALVASALVVAPIQPGTVFYVFSPPGDMELAFRLALIDAGMPSRHSIVWVKDRFAFGRSDYHYRHETLLYGWVDGAAHYFVDDRTQDSVWECDQPRASTEHPTMKPVALVERAVGNSSRADDVVYEPFSGSGTTLIAAEALGRRCYAMELEPRYVQVAIVRWQEFTGREAIRG
jgi:DNA modification methylase